MASALVPPDELLTAVDRLRRPHGRVVALAHGDRADHPVRRVDAAQVAVVLGRVAAVEEFPERVVKVRDDVLLTLREVEVRVHDDLQVV